LRQEVWQKSQNRSHGKVDCLALPIQSDHSHLGLSPQSRSRCDAASDQA
jgi:hypothetical protein